MSDLLVRPYASGYMVAEPRVREYADGLAITGYRARYYSTASDAARAVERRLESQDTPEAPEGTQAKRATYSEPKPFDYRPCLLKPQAKELIRLMIENGGVTTLEAMHAGIGRPSARVLEIRSVYGDDAVPKTWEKTADGRRYARYFWRGPDSIQLEIGDAA